MQLSKVTKQRKANDKRRYDDACGLAHALELIGERWALMVLRELMFGPRRFSELKADLPGISANVLTQRLAELEQRGLVRRTKLPPPASVQVYEATRWGLDAAPVISALGKWAARSPCHDPTLPISHVSTMLSIRGLLDAELAKDLRGTIGFRFGDVAYVASLAEGKLEVERREPSGCDVVFTGTPKKILEVLYLDTDLEAIDVEGDIALARRFVTLFRLPTKVDHVEAGAALP